MRFFGRKGEGRGRFDGVYSPSLVRFLFTILFIFQLLTSLFSLVLRHPIPPRSLTTPAPHFRSHRDLCPSGSLENKPYAGPELLWAVGLFFGFWMSRTGWLGWGCDVGNVYAVMGICGGRYVGRRIGRIWGMKG